MEKIDGSSGFLYRPDVTPKKEQEKKSGKTQKSSFTGVLGSLFNQASEAQSLSAHEPGSDDELRELMDEIHKLGDKLLKFPGIDNLAQYKQAIRDFFNHTTGNAYVAEEQISRRNILNQKKYTIIKMVDQKLDTLTKAMLSSQSLQIDILSDIEEIQGLLIDITHVS